MKKQVVIFRKMIGTGQVVALFPEDHDSYGECVYRHLFTVPELSDGKWANYKHMIDRSLPVKNDESKDLLNKLRQVGYDNVVRQKWNERKKGIQK